MTNQHAPAPWSHDVKTIKVIDGGEVRLAPFGAVYDAKGDLIATFSLPGAAAHTRLFAIAPDAIAALDALVQLYGLRDWSGDALRPAEGQEPEIADAMRVLQRYRGEI